MVLEEKEKERQSSSVSAEVMHTLIIYPRNRAMNMYFPVKATCPVSV